MLYSSAWPNISITSLCGLVPLKVPIACTSRAQEVLLWGWARLVLGFEALVHGMSEAHGEG